MMSDVILEPIDSMFDVADVEHQLATMPNVVRDGFVDHEYLAFEKREPREQESPLDGVTRRRFHTARH